jgi:hypothetical protein
MTLGAEAARLSAFVRPALAALAFAAFAVPPGANAASSKGTVAVRVSIQPTLQLQTLALQPSYVVTTDDAANLSSWIPDAATIEVFCNLHGYSLRFDIVDPAVTEVEIDGLDAPVKVGAVGRTVFIPVSQSSPKRTRHTFAYRVHYAAGVTPGTRGVPVRVSVGNI